MLTLLNGWLRGGTSAFIHLCYIVIGRRRVMYSVLCIVHHDVTCDSQIKHGGIEKNVKK
jgi:hypothetical protein